MSKHEPTAHINACGTGELTVFIDPSKVESLTLLGDHSEHYELRDLETCGMEYVSDFMSWHCKACDMMDMAPRSPKPRYCKWCGRKVVDE